MNLTKCALLVACGWTALGCTSTAVQDEIIKGHRKCWSHIAWHMEKPKLKADGGVRPWLDDFGRGWRQGYYDVAMGGSGTIPLLPPTRYWGTFHHNPTGREEVQAWFAGYQQGVTAAEGDAVGQWIAIPQSGGEEMLREMKRRRRHPAAEPIPTGAPVDQQPVIPEDLPVKPGTEKPEELPQKNKVTLDGSSRRPRSENASEDPAEAPAQEVANEVTPTSQEVEVTPEPAPRVAPAPQPKRKGLSLDKLRLGS